MGMNANVLERAEVESLLHSILEEQNLQDAKLEISAGSEKGDGFMSFITQVAVSGKDRKLNLVIKCAPKSEDFRKLMPIEKIFLREIYFYDTIYPTMEKFQAQIAHPFKNVPKCFKTISDPSNEMLIMEDIRKQGYKLWNKKIAMNEEHITKVFQEYGKFHAVSYALKEHDLEQYKNLTSKMDEVYKMDDSNKDMFDGFLMAYTQVIDLFNDDSNIQNVLGNFKDSMMDFFKMLENGGNKFSVITHGDCWCNNMMFKYEDNPLRPTDMCLLDFQLCMESSPVRDLSYFFYVSAARNNLAKLDDYLIIYLESLKNHLVALGCDAEKCLTMEDLRAEWKTYGKFGFLASIMLLRIMLSEVDEIIDFTDIAENGYSIKDMFNRDMKLGGLRDERLKDIALHMVENEFI